MGKIKTYGFRVYGVDLKDHKTYSEKNPLETVVEKEYRMSCLYLHRDLESLCGYDICVVNGELLQNLTQPWMFPAEYINHDGQTMTVVVATWVTSRGMEGYVFLPTDLKAAEDAFMKNQGLLNSCGSYVDDIYEHYPELRALKRAINHNQNA